MAGNVSQTELPHRHSQIITDKGHKAKTQGAPSQAIEILCLDKVTVDVRFVQQWVYRDQCQWISVAVTSVWFPKIHKNSSDRVDALKKDYFLTQWEAGKTLWRFSQSAKRINYKRLKSFSK